MKIIKQFPGFCGPASLRSGLLNLVEQSNGKIPQSRIPSQLEIARRIFPQKRNIRAWMAEDGCDPEHLVKVAKNLGFWADYRENCEIKDLTSAKENNNIVIVNYVSPIWQDEHYSTFEGIINNHILLGDPKAGQVIALDHASFLYNWKEGDMYQRTRPLKEREAIFIGL